MISMLRFWLRACTESVICGTRQKLLLIWSIIVPLSLWKWRLGQHLPWCCRAWGCNAWCDSNLKPRSDRTVCHDASASSRLSWSDQLDSKRISKRCDCSCAAMPLTAHTKFGKNGLSISIQKMPVICLPGKQSVWSTRPLVTLILIEWKISRWNTVFFFAPRSGRF